MKHPEKLSVTPISEGNAGILILIIIAVLLSWIALNIDMSEFVEKEEAVVVVRPDKIQKKVKLFSEHSAFNQKIADDANIDADSDLMVGSLIEVYKSQGMLIAKDRWSIAVYYADGNTPRYDVKRTPYWEPSTKLHDVPIPDFAVPDPGEGHMAIIDLSTGYEYDFWGALKVDGEWTAGWASKAPYNGSGIYADGHSCRGSGMVLTAGLIWPEELADGHIDHALIFSYPYTKAKKYVYPATKTDGTSKREDAIPIGARIQLDPDLDLESLGLTSYEMTIARALQEYGMILCDTNGGSIELEAVNPISAKSNSYEGLLPEGTHISLDKIPVESFRILELDR